MTCKGKKYVTINDEGTDFRKISKIMTSIGYPLNHATARNQLLHGMKKLLQSTSHEFKTDISEQHLNQLIESKEIHDALQDVIYLVYRKKLEKINKNG